MGMASPYALDPEWYDGPNYTEIIALPPINQDVYFAGRSIVGPTWDFENSDIHNWLEENCKGKFNYNWGIELEDDRMLVHIGFAKEKYVKAFKEKFETIDWNMECEEKRILLNVHKLFYQLDDSGDKDVYEEAAEVIQWCRENTHGLWKPLYHGQDGMFFYFIQDGDGAAFTLRWL